VNNTKDIVEFALTSVESIGSGIYRFEGTTNNVIASSKDYLSSYLGTLDQLLTKKQELTKQSTKDQLPTVLGSYQDILNYREAIVKLQNEVKDLEKKAETDLISSILKNADNFIPAEIKEITYIVTDNLPQASLKPLVDVLYDKMKTEAIVLINKGDKATFLVKTSKLIARDLLKDLTSKTNGNGGGKNDFAQGGTADLVALENFLKGL